MKRTIAILLCLFLIGTLALSVSAASAHMSLSSSAGTVYRGDTFTLTVTLSNDQPVSNGGIVLKFNASQRYCTDGVSAAILRKVCAKADVPVQTYCNRADIPGGSTLGHISLTHVSVPTADVGLPQLAMHSSYETIASADLEALERAMTAYYGTTLVVTADGGCEIR